MVAGLIFNAVTSFIPGGKLGVMAIVGVALAGIVGGAYWHYTGLLEDINQLREDRVVLQLQVAGKDAAIKDRDGAITEWKAAVDEIQIQTDEAWRVADEARAHVRRLEDVFAGHDLTELAKKKPGLIERRINSGTADVLRMLECASGETFSCSDTDGRSSVGQTGAPQSSAYPE